MKKMIVLLDDYSVKVLAKSPNKSETIRQALRVYDDDISTDTLAGIRQAFVTLNQNQQIIQSELQKIYELVEPLAKKVLGSYDYGA